VAPIITTRSTHEVETNKGPRMKTRELCLVLVLSSILQLVGIAFFARGFFPYKKVLPGFATGNGPQDFVDFGLEPVGPPEKLFDRMVFIVVDALRRYSGCSIGCLTLVISCSPLTPPCHLFTGRRLFD